MDSWGNGRWAEQGEKITEGGNCVIPADYVNEFTFSAMLGIGKADMGSKDYVRPRNNCVMFIAGTEVPVFRDENLEHQIRILMKGEVTVMVDPESSDVKHVVKIAQSDGYICRDAYKAGTVQRA